MNNKKTSLLDLIKMCILLEYIQKGKEPPTEETITKAVKKAIKENPNLFYKFADKNYSGTEDLLGQVLKITRKYLAKN